MIEDLGKSVNENWSIWINVKKRITTKKRKKLPRRARRNIKEFNGKKI